MIMGERVIRVLFSTNQRFNSVPGNWCVFHPTHPDLTKTETMWIAAAAFVCPKPRDASGEEGKRTTGGGDGIRAAAYGKHGSNSIRQ